ncbi:MAG TPA: fused MFS/spermidine synthase [Bryobacteraceae bacterium]|nr:fused MFS/spermidine synthase [Bryobacteraceae bacterium]
MNRPPAPEDRTVPAIYFGATILLGAFLLFQVQPLIAKLILPWFGGSAAVWTSCMLFFQVALLAGYGYAHWVNRQTTRVQAIFHSGLLALSLFSLPILPSASWKPQGGEDPLLRICGLLAVTVGLPYFLLSSTSPLLQAWYSRANGGAMPWRFFALSNAGSMLGLLTYPILVEPWLTSGEQAWMWSISYGVFALVCATVAWCVRGVPVRMVVEESAKAPGLADRVIWIGLAACASALLLAVTNHLTQNVAAIPFLWVLPLSLYLLSFILCFDSDRWYHREVFIPLAAISLPAIAIVISKPARLIDIRVALAYFSITTFILFMVCQGELARRRPGSSQLTSFYLMVSAGGAIGGLLIGLAAPYYFNALYDFPVVIAGTAFLFVWLLLRERRTVLFAVGLLLAIGTTVVLGSGVRDSIGHSRVLVRNFYGALRVHDDSNEEGPMGPFRVLMHGTIDHGEEFLSPAGARFPTTYYSRGSGVGLAILNIQKQGPAHIGVVGLGAGTLAAYARPIDRVTFYEINPLVPKIAGSEFRFLADCPAPHEVILGDARLSLEDEPAKGFDVLAVDAFSGDSIPVHLLTREAFALYWRHLKPDGVLAVHVTNRNLALAPVVALAAAESGKRAMIVSNDADYDRRVFQSQWVLVTSRPGFFEQAEIKEASEPIGIPPGLTIWRDDYSNLFRILRYRKP